MVKLKSFLYNFNIVKKQIYNLSVELERDMNNMNV